MRLKPREDEAGSNEVARKTPVKRSCHVCGRPALVRPSLVRPSLGEFVDFDCPSCGKYRMTGSAIDCLSQEAMDALDRRTLSAHIRNRPSGRSGRVLITAHDLRFRWVTHQLVNEHGLGHQEAERAASVAWHEADDPNAVVLRVIGTRRQMAARPTAADQGFAPRADRDILQGR